MAVIFGWNFIQKKYSQDAAALLNEVPSVPKSIKERIEKNVAPLLPESASKYESFSDDNQSANRGKGNQEQGIVLNVIKDGLVEIKDENGEKIVSEKLKAGDQYFIPNSPKLTMTLGNAGGVEIVIDGKALMPLGKENTVRSDIPLDIYYLKTLEFKKVDKVATDKDLVESTGDKTPNSKDKSSKAKVDN